MFEEDLLSTQIYLQYESKDIFKTVIDCSVDSKIGHLHLFYRSGKTKKITIPYDSSCFLNISYDNKFVFIGSGWKKTLNCYELESQKMVWKTNVKSDVGKIFPYENKIYCQLDKGIFIYNANTGEEIGKIKKTIFDDVFTVGKDLLVFYFAGKLRSYDMSHDQMISEKQIFKKEDDYSFAKIISQTENSTSVKFFFGDENSNHERSNKEVTFYEKNLKE